MPSTRTILFALAAVSLFFARGASAQDRLESIMKKATLSVSDRATMKAEAGARVKRLLDAAPDKVGEARDRILRTAKMKDASVAAVDAYCQECADELESAVSAGTSESSLTGALLLVDLDNPKTAGALAAGLRNPRAAVRYTAARGIIALQPRLKGDEDACTRALAELGKAGAAERDEFVLRKIYLAMAFKAAAPDFKFDDALASGLAEFLAGRATVLAGGSRNELIDEPASDIAKSCYPGATPPSRAKLIGSMTALLANAVDRYFSPETAPELLPRLSRLIGALESTIHGMMTESKVTPPAGKVAAAIKGDGNAADHSTEARKALEAIRTTLRGEPWKLTSP